MEKSNSQRLKKSKKFAFGNSQFTKQHNISLSGAINKDKIVYTSDQTSDHHQLGGRRVGLRKKRCVGTTDSNFHGQRKLSLEQQLCQPGGPGFKPRPGRGLNFRRPSFATSSVDRDVKPLV